MTHARLIEHLETALLQEDPARRLHLAGLVLVSNPGHGPARALTALCVPDLERASPLLEGAAALRPGGLAGASPALRAVVEAARATRDLVGLDPHAAAERLSGYVRASLPSTVAGPVLRLSMAACAATGDLEGLARALDRSAGLPRIAAEARWFRWMLASRIGDPRRDELLDEAEAGLPALRDAADGKTGHKPGNPGAFADGVAAVSVAAVLPGLFRAGGLPARKRRAVAA